VKTDQRYTAYISLTGPKRDKKNRVGDTKGRKCNLFNANLIFWPSKSFDGTKTEQGPYKKGLPLYLEKRTSVYNPATKESGHQKILVLSGLKIGKTLQRVLWGKEPKRTQEKKWGLVQIRLNLKSF